VTEDAVRSNIYAAREKLLAESEWPPEPGLRNAKIWCKSTLENPAVRRRYRTPWVVIRAPQILYDAIE